MDNNKVLGKALSKLRSGKRLTSDEAAAIMGAKLNGRMDIEDMRSYTINSATNSAGNNLTWLVIVVLLAVVGVLVAVALCGLAYP